MASTRRIATRIKRHPPALADPKGHEAFAERLRHVIRETGTILALSEKAGVSDSTIHLWLRDSEPSREKLVNLAEAAGVSVEWLATGRGEMRADRVPEGYVLVPRYEIGEGRGFEGSDYLALKTEWIAKLPGNPAPHALHLFEASGDAMSPAIADGDLVLVNAFDPDLRDGGVYAIYPASTAPTLPLMFRRARQRADGTFEFIRDDDPERHLVEPAKAFHTVGRAIWAGGPL